MGMWSLLWTWGSYKKFIYYDGLVHEREKVRTKLKTNEESSFFENQYKERDEPRRINLNDLLKRSKEEKAKIKKTNVLVFSAVLSSAALVVLIISYL